MNIYRNPQGDYYLQYLPENQEYVSLYSLKHRTLVDVDITEFQKDFVNIEELDFVTTKATTPKLLEELRNRKDNPFDYKEEDVLSHHYMLVFMDDGDTSFTVVEYADSYKEALEKQSSFGRKSTIVKVLNIVAKE